LPAPRQAAIRPARQPGSRNRRARFAPRQGHAKGFAPALGHRLPRATCRTGLLGAANMAGAASLGVGNRCIGSRIIETRRYYDRPHHPVLHPPVAGCARRLDAYSTGARTSNAAIWLVVPLAPKKHGCLGRARVSASTRTPSRNARLGPSGGVATPPYSAADASRRADWTVRKPIQTR